MDDFSKDLAWDASIKKMLWYAVPFKKWHIVSISVSKQSSSVYIYLYRKEHIFQLRLADHTQAERGMTRCTQIYWDKDTTANEVIGRIRHVFAKGLIRARPFGLTEFLILRLVSSTYGKNNRIGVFMQNDHSLLIEGENIGAVLLEGEPMYFSIMSLNKSRLLNIYKNGHLSITHNGLDFLRKYSELRSNAWPKYLSSYSWESVVQMLKNNGVLDYKEEYISVEEPSSSNNIVSLSEQPALQKLSALLNLNEPANVPKEDVKPIKDTPKKWRQLVLNEVESHLPYKYKIVSQLLLSRRRVIYLQILGDAYIYTIRFGSRQKERTTVEYAYAQNNEVIAADSGKLAGQEAASIDITSLDKIKLRWLMFVWLKIIQLGENHRPHYQVRFSPRKQSVKITNFKNNTVTFLPRSHCRWIAQIILLGWVQQDSHGCHVSPVGKQILENYREIALNQSTFWDLELASDSRSQAMKRLKTN